MTAILERPTPPVRDRPPAGDLGRVAALAACGVAAVGFGAVVLVVLVYRLADGRAGAHYATTLRTAADVWLAGHGAGLRTADGTLGLVPLGLTVGPLLLLMRAGRTAARRLAVRGCREVLRVTAAVTVAYVLVAVGVAVGSATREAAAGPLRTGVAVSLLALLGAGLGAARQAGLVPPMAGRRSACRPVPDRVERVQRVLLAAGAACIAMLGAGSLLVAGSLLTHLGRTVDLASAPAAGLVGGSGMLLLALLLSPNAVLWGAAWLAGPGFAIGRGTAVGPFTTRLGAVPRIPLLAGLPTGSQPGWAMALLVPVLAGALAGVLVHRRGAASWTQRQAAR